MTRFQIAAALTAPRALGAVLASLFGAVQCVGTEADNPFAEPADVTKCKSELDFVPLAPHIPLGELGARRLADLSQPLTSSSEVPVWLQCVDWSLGTDGNLALQVLNFDGGCAIEWKGASRITAEGAVLLELENANPGCAVAGCGNCIYDVRVEVQLDEELRETNVPFKLAILPCDGSNGRDSSWLLPLSEQASGTRCVPSDGWAAVGAKANGAGRSDELFTPCTTDAAPDPDALPTPVLDCGEGLACVSERCVPACSADGDCPLQGALTCQGGFCQLRQP
jgi:hypothetical protein